MKKRLIILVTTISFSFTLPLYMQDTEYLFKYGTRQQKISAINVFMRQKTLRELILLIDSLKDENEDLQIRKYIIHALKVFKSKRAKHAIIWALECEISGLRSHAALVISKYPLNEVMYPIINALSDKSHKVRKNALLALFRIGNKSVLPFIRRMLRDNHPEVRFQARMTYRRILNKKQ